MNISKQMKKYKHNITNDILEQITTALKKSKIQKKEMYVDTFIKEIRQSILKVSRN